MNIFKKTSTKRAFTLPEVLITLALFAIIAAISIPYLGNFFTSQNVDSQCKNIRQILYRASYRSIAGERGSPWGVHFANGTYTLFAGKNYNTRLTQFDEINNMPSGMSFPISADYIFTLYTGEPEQTGTVSVYFDSKTTLCVSVEASGLVEYQ